MAVGQPETNLNTWGLRYVKKTRAPSAKPSESTTAHNRISDADSDTPDAFRGRQEDSKGDKDVKVIGHAGRESGHTPEVATQIQSPKEGKYGVGSSIPAGSTQGKDREDAKPPRKGDLTPKLTPQGKPQTEGSFAKNPKGLASGSDASHESGIQSIETRTGKTRHGDDVDPEKKGKPTHSALPKAKAEMELAIIKCKLLKMNDISKKGEWDHLPHAQKEKEHDKEEEKVEKGTKDYGSDNTGRPSIGIADDPEPTPNKRSVKDPPTSQVKDREDEEVTSYGEGASGNQYGGKITHGDDYDKKLTHGGKVTQASRNKPPPESRSATKNDEIVEKAIELINEAYDEMKSDGFKKLKPTYEGDTKQAKKDAPSTTSSEGSANFVYSDVKEAEKQKQ